MGFRSLGFGGERFQLNAKQPQAESMKQLAVWV